MPRLFKKSAKPVGGAPGELFHVGEKEIEHVQISLMDYNQDHITEHMSVTIDAFFSLRDDQSVTWLNICGIHDIELIEKIGHNLNIHPLVMEDIVNSRQRPKIEDFEDYIFILLKMLYIDDKDNEIKAEQVSVILGSNFVISFQETEKDVRYQLSFTVSPGRGYNL